MNRGIVVTAHPAATDAGCRILACGGNAVDAAVAAAWALCVCEPSGSGLGGQTVLLLHARGRTIAIDGHSFAPARVSRQTVTRAQQRIGYRATTVPTTPATLSHVHAHFGGLPAARVIEPALELAEDGFGISRLQHRQLRWCQALLEATPAGARFLRDGRPYRPGQVFTQPQLAACLRRIIESGVEDFYRGAIARSIDRDMRRNGGLLELADLQALGAPTEREPVSGRYRGQWVMTMPSPGGGPQLLHALSSLEQLDGSTWRDRPAAWYHAICYAVRGAFEHREREHRGAAAGIQAPLLQGVGGERHGETTHLCAADTDGNFVSLTQSIQSLFGGKVANSDYGFLYNNYLTTCPRRRHSHRLAGGCPVRSNASPTLVFDHLGSSPRLSLGSAGSRRIISSLVQVISGMFDRELTLAEAVAHPRVHPRLRGKVWLERPAATGELVHSLSERFGTVEIRGRESYAMGAVQALAVARGSGMQAAADPRRDGTADRC